MGAETGRGGQGTGQDGAARENPAPGERPGHAPAFSACQDGRSRMKPA